MADHLISDIRIIYRIHLGESPRVDGEVDCEDTGGGGEEHHGAVVRHEGEAARGSDRLCMNGHRA